MNDYRREINDFYERIKPEFTKILKIYDGKQPQRLYVHIVVPCRKFIQKFSFKSPGDTQELCELLYWLYILDHKQLALTICEFTHGSDFFYGQTCWNSDITCLYGLEIRIARELLGEKREIAMPKTHRDYCLSKSVERRQHYPKVLKEQEIARSHDVYEILSALYDMIGRGETGLYPSLNENWEKIEEVITKYSNALRKFITKAN